MLKVITKNENNPVWIGIDDVSNVLNLSAKTVKEQCRCGKFTYKIEKDGYKNRYFINFNSLPDFAQRKFIGLKNSQLKNYSDAPVWAKEQAERYDNILHYCDGLKGQALEEFVKEWNINNPNNMTSYSNIIRMRRRYKEDGINGLLARYGHKGVMCPIEDKYFDYFKKIYMVEGSPSLKSCWQLTLGYAIRTDNINQSNFPSHMTFKRRLEKEVPASSIYLARKGMSAWNRKYGGYIERDYSNIKCGEVWVSDHAQIDIACFDADGKVVFPWVTAWRDYKSGKWLGWSLQCGSPNSDRIFQTFYYAASEYGLPKDVIIDNGKDYRSNDFAGGRGTIKIETNQIKTRSMLDELNVKVHFALPYNAQTKPIERDFLKIKEKLSKHCIGYRGGNVVERPEKLAEEIKKGKVLNFDRFKKVFDLYIVDVFNKMDSDGKNLNGKCPDELFNEEFKEKIVTTKDALKLFCTRTSRNFTIGRNGIKDKGLGITYWNDWMISYTGTKVYLRRDPQNYKEAWVFKAENEEFIGIATAVRAVAALHAETVSKEEFQDAMAIKKRNLKLAKSYIEQTEQLSVEEIYENYKALFNKPIKDANPRVTKIANTNMDKAIQRSKEMAAFGKADLSIFMDDSEPEEELLYLFETDKIVAQEMKGVASGY
ncbi:Mu transposase C-terminal domain-containing protein [bacterium]|nr:Mu transposase C-terminal domain-containing protein [bacterium]